ncbi:MAG: transposase, partial [Gemmatimonadaceae bacterium]
MDGRPRRCTSSRIDRVRVDAANRLARAAGAGAVRDRRRPIKGARWLLLRNTASLQRGERLRLKTLLAANRPLGVVYVLTDAWKALWRYQYP